MPLSRRASVYGVVLLIVGSLGAAKKPTTRPSSNWAPPVGDAPANRVGGAARACETDPTLLVSLLSPTHSLGLTASAQPTLYWYLTKATTRPIEISLTPLSPDGKDTGAAPVLDVVIPKTEAGGIQSLSLAHPPGQPAAGQQGAVKLEPGVQYAWVVEVVVHDRNGSDNPSATTRLKCIKAPADVAAAQSADPAEQYDVYRQAGLWYDMLDSLNRMIDTEKDNADRKQTRKELLKDQSLIESDDGKITEKPKKE